MQQSKGLLCSVIDRHFCYQVLMTNFREFNAQVLHHVVGRQPIELVEGNASF